MAKHTADFHEDSYINIMGKNIRVLSLYWSTVGLLRPIFATRLVDARRTSTDKNDVTSWKISSDSDVKIPYSVKATHI
jgi:hypothetical protein